MQACFGGTEALSPVMDVRILRALARLEADFSRHLTVAQMAADIGLSRSRFEHLFKQSTGDGFKTRLRRLRLMKARALLSEYKLSIKEIAFRCGYSNLPSFSRDFKKLFLTSPSLLRHSTIRQKIAHSDNKLLLTGS